MLSNTIFCCKQITECIYTEHSHLFTFGRFILSHPPLPPTYFHILLTTIPLNPFSAVTALNWSWHPLASFVAVLLYKNMPGVLFLSDQRSYCRQALVVSTVQNIPQMSLQNLICVFFSNTTLLCIVSVLHHLLS